jgi:hypothetical protein
MAGQIVERMLRMQAANMAQKRIIDRLSQAVTRVVVIASYHRGDNVEAWESVLQAVRRPEDARPEINDDVAREIDDIATRAAEEIMAVLAREPMEDGREPSGS